MLTNKKYRKSLKTPVKLRSHIVVQSFLLRLVLLEDFINRTTIALVVVVENPHIVKRLFHCAPNSSKSPSLELAWAINIS